MSDQDFSRTIQLISIGTHKINENVGRVNRLSNILGTSRDNIEIRNSLVDILDQTRNVVHDIQNSMRRLANLPVDCLQQTQIDRVHTELKAAVQRYELASKYSLDRISRPIMSTSVDMYVDEQSPLRRNSHSSLLMDLETVDIATERDDAMNDIANSMQQINDIYVDLNNIILTQGPQLDTIEDHICSADYSVETGVQHLNKASQYQSSARKRCCCCLVLVLIIAAILATVLATKLG